MYPNAIAFAKRFKKPLVLFDIEHTGGTKENRAITEFAALVVQPDGIVSEYASLVKPKHGTHFMPMICSLTGIWPKTVAKAPSWPTVMTKFVLPHRDSIWVGFNSRACDTPIILAECRKYGTELDTLPHQFDLVRVGSVSGRLAARVEHWAPDFDTNGAHRAAKDALMTLVLLEAMLPTIEDTALEYQGLLPRTKTPRKLRAAPVIKAEAVAAAPLDFLVKPGMARRGQSWSAAETQWVTEGFKAGKLVDELADAVGRSKVAIAFVLERFQLLTEDQRHYLGTSA